MLNSTLFFDVYVMISTNVPPGLKCSVGITACTYMYNPYKAFYKAMVLQICTSSLSVALVFTVFTDCINLTSVNVASLFGNRSST